MAFCTLQPAASRFGQWLRHSFVPGRTLSTLGCALGLALFVEVARCAEPSGVTYTNVVVPAEPWSIHVVKIDRSGTRYEIQAPHAGKGALGLSTLRDQIAVIGAPSATPSCWT